MQDQRHIWERIHSKEWDDSTLAPNGFALEVEPLFRRTANVLELGCGRGADAAFFASKGHMVTATDLSQQAIARNREHFANTAGLAFLVHDTTEPLPFANACFDLVYAHLSLHYFTDAMPRIVFGEIARVLTCGGHLAFLCKSTDDPIFGKGREIEADMYEADHVRHFFSEEYALRCLETNFECKRIESSSGLFYGSLAASIRVIARRV